MFVKARTFCGSSWNGMNLHHRFHLALENGMLTFHLYINDHKNTHKPTLLMCWCIVARWADGHVSVVSLLFGLVLLKASVCKSETAPVDFLSPHCPLVTLQRKVCPCSCTSPFPSSVNLILFSHLCILYLGFQYYIYTIFLFLDLFII